MNLYQRFKRNIFDVIQPFADASAGRLASRIFDDFIMLLIVFSVVSVFLCTFRIPEWLLRMLIRIEFWSLVVFTIEYALRIWTANLLFPELGPFRSRIRYILSPMALIDLISILPFLLPFMPYTFVGVRAFRLVRLLRIFKLNRYSDALAAIGDVFRRKAQQIVASIFFVSIILVLASLLIYYAEHDAQPEQFENAFSGLWWAVATLTTVGYGDIYPITPIGRFLGAIIAILGIGMVAVPTSILSAGFMEMLEGNTSGQNNKTNPPRDQAPAGAEAESAPAASSDGTTSGDAPEPPQYCPHCGKKLFP